MQRIDVLRQHPHRSKAPHAAAVQIPQFVAQAHAFILLLRYTQQKIR